MLFAVALVSFMSTHASRVLGRCGARQTRDATNAPSRVPRELHRTRSPLLGDASDARPLHRRSSAVKSAQRREVGQSLQRKRSPLLGDAGDARPLHRRSSPAFD
jgi:hypothetical protein